MHWTYNDLPPEPTILGQGDVLKRTPELEAVLRAYYPYFVDNDKNQSFLVLTQACDLVPREGGVCKAKYIELAAVRPLRALIANEMADLAHGGFDLPFAVAGQKARTRFENFLESLFNNNKSDYFYLHAEPGAGLPESSCAFLHLSVPIKAEHYSVCIQARILTLQTVFQAKLGWLVGQIYARVGTDDWDSKKESKKLRAAIQAAAEEAGFWLPDKRLKQAVAKTKEWRALNPDAPITKAKIAELVKSLPSEKAEALARIKFLLSNSLLFKRLMLDGHANANDLDKLLAQMQADPVLSGLFPAPS